MIPMHNGYKSSCLFVLIYACDAYIRCENGVNSTIYTPRFSHLQKGAGTLLAWQLHSRGAHQPPLFFVILVGPVFVIQTIQFINWINKLKDLEASYILSNL